VSIGRDYAWLASVIEGRPSPDAIAAMSGALLRWWRFAAAGGCRRVSLARCAGLPENPARARLALRDHYLRRAAALLDVPASQPWRRAEAMAAAADLFMRRKWPVWWSLAAAPEHAEAIERLLWHAAQAGGGKLPGTARWYHKILG